MRYKGLVSMFAIGFSILFSIMYLCVFHYYIPTDENVESLTLYMNQIGLYKEEKNALKVQKDLLAQDVKTYIYKQNDLYVVVSGIGEKKAAESNGETLKKLSYSHILKEYEIHDPSIVSYAKEKNYEKVLEMIGNQSQGDGK